jgi:hypothetical protein
MTYHRVCNSRLPRRMPLVGQELLTLPEYLSSLPSFSEVRVTRSLVLCVCFVVRRLFFFFWSLCCLSFFYLPLTLYIRSVFFLISKCSKLRAYLIFKTLYIRSVFFLIPKCSKLRTYLINKTMYIRSVFFLIPKYSKLSALTDTLHFKFLVEHRLGSCFYFFY